jgi:DNA-binding GntR family transcriptional regulator
MKTFGASRATVLDAAARLDSKGLLELPVGAPVLIRRRLTYGERQVPVEYVGGVYHAARHTYRRHLRRRRFHAGEPDCAVPELSGTELDASAGDEVTGGAG